jgi:hypothetical protein
MLNTRLKLGVSHMVCVHFSNTTSRVRLAVRFISNVDLMERVLLTNKIYRKILCIKEHGSMMTVTLNGSGGFDVSAYSWPPQYRILSWDLLVWILVEGRIPSSFTLLQLQSYLDPCRSAPVFTTPRLRNTLWRQSFEVIAICGELFSLEIRYLF